MARTATVLLVDDDEGMRYTLGRTLKRAGYRIIEAANGYEALARAQERPDIIVLDVRLPDIDGIEVCRRLKADADTLSIPVLQVSAERVSVQDQVAGLEGGADAYLTHPIDNSVLTATVKALLRIRETERALAQSERFFQVVAEAIPQLVWSVRADGRGEYVNRHWIDYTGINLAVEADQCWTAAVHVDEQERARNDWHIAQRDGIVFEGEYRFRRIDDTHRWFLVRAVPLHNDNGAVEKWFGSCTDIDVRLRAEQNIAAEKNRLAVTLDSISDGVITTDNEGRVELMNPVAERLTGWSQAEVSGRMLGSVLHMLNPATRAQLSEPLTVSHDEQNPAPQHCLILIARDGSERMVEECVAPIRRHNSIGVGVVVVLRDVTEKQRWEESLIKTQKLESLGVLAGGIAHDFNNLLTAILGNISLARLPGVSADELLTEAEKACLRARGLTHQLLTFAKGGAPIKRTVALEALVRDAANFSARGSNAHCEFTVDPNLPPAEVDADQIGQVINNLVLNAAESMPEGGKVQIALTRAPATAAGVPDHIQIQVADSGTGIQPKHLTKIFDPYFTTKQKGSGLGLAVVYSIVRKHGGEITVDSELGLGTRFTVLLPSAPIVTAPPLPAAPADTAAESTRVLLLDDEDAIVQFARHVLAKLGYPVTAVREGGAALRAFDEALAAGAPYTVAVLDLTIHGGMGGRECAVQLRARGTAIKLIAASGYSTDPIMCEPRAHGFDDVLPKPFLPNELTAVIKRVLTADA